jgi:hypothetical protein
MDNDKPLERGEKGDVKFDTGLVDWEKIRKSRYTYVFRYYDEKKTRYFPNFGLFSCADERMDKAKLNPEFYEKQLYWTPDHPPYDFFIRYHNWQLGMLVEFFKEVFEERAFIEGYQPSHKYYRIILPKSKHDEIINFINDFELLGVRDLLFELIATAQHKYVEKIAFWERPQMQKLISTAEKETQKAIEVIEKLDTEAWERGELGSKPPSELQYINFVFNDGVVKIEHAWLAQEFIDHFKRYYSDLHYKNWKLDLERYPERFEENIVKQQYKYKLAKSFYNLLTKCNFSPIKEEEPTPNRLMLCIVRLLEFCLIPVAGPDELDEIKIKNLRNWLKRNELQPALTRAEISANKERLLKYFEPELINITDEVKNAEAIAIALFISKRFNIDHLFADITHIAQALRESVWMIGHQMLGDGRSFEPQFDEFRSFSKLVNGVITGQKITSIKYTLEGDDKEHELTQRLPLYLIEQSLKDYSEENQVEFDTDPVKTKITRTNDGGLKVDKEDKFNLPETRFMVRIVKSLYDYLLVEAPPTDEREFMPSERYYGIIANLLQDTWFFYHQRHPEWFIIEKVKDWHKMAQIKQKEKS